MTIFHIVSIVELCLFIIYCKSKSFKRTFTLKVRVVVFLVYLLFLFLPILTWSFRYYALTAYGLFLALHAIIKVSSKKNKVENYSLKLNIIRLIMMIIISFFVTLPLILFPQNVPTIDATGQYKVNIEMMTLTDTNRIEEFTDKNEYRTLNVQCHYPDTMEYGFPLVIFSHGGLGVKSSNESLYNELASHGYVVCSIDHTYYSFFTKNDNNKVTLVSWSYAQEILLENPNKDINQSFEYYQKWMDLRIKDMQFVLDVIVDKSSSKANSDFFKMIDASKIGVMGHSLDGSAALKIGRLNEQVQAVIALESPLMGDIVEVKNNQFVFTETPYPRPVLHVYSDSSWDILSKRVQYQANYELLTSTDEQIHHMYISGTGHLGLTDFSLTSPLLTRVLDNKKPTRDAIETLSIINQKSLAFFDFYFKQKGEFSSKYDN